MAITTGGGVSTLSTDEFWSTVYQMLQMQDGSFVGTFTDPTTGNYGMVGFGQGGGIRWIVPNEAPLMATTDGGVIGASGVTYDQNGSATGMVETPTYSWKGAYTDGPVDSIVPQFDLALMSTSFAAVPGGNLTGNGFYMQHHTFGLVFCGPAPGDGTCSSTPNVTFSYLAGINDQNYGQATDFSQAYPGWVRTIKEQALNTYVAAFANLPAIVAKKEAPTMLYGGSTAAKSFEHTIYISGYWMPPGVYPRSDSPYPPNGYTPLSNSGSPVSSLVYYLPIMGNAQDALGASPVGSSGQPTGGWIPLSPSYPPANQAATAQFNALVTAIGTVIGNAAAHETGHQLPVASMDCDSPSGIAGYCESQYVYEYYSSAPVNLWWYESVPGEKLHWSQAATCSIEQYLLGKSYVSLDKACTAGQ
jgi:hypothetical protein